MIDLERHDEVTPVCPHCSAGLRQIWYREVRGQFGRRYVYFCGECSKVLGLSHRKGFWMG